MTPSTAQPPAQHCIHWQRTLPHGPGTCTLGMHGGRPYIGNCQACPHHYPAEAPADPADRNLLLTYDTGNLGDDIQATAVADLMPGISGTVLRSHLATTPATGRMLLAGWFTTGPGEWPPAPGIAPTFLSFHAHDPRTITHHIDLLRAHAPIACRDQATVDLCRANGIEAWWAGCVTLTLQSDCTPPANAKPITVDYPIPGIENLTQSITGNTPHRMAQARAHIDRLAQARCVITTRLHTALPCAALGIPCLLIGDPADPRFTGLSQLVHFAPLTSPSSLPSLISSFLDTPPPNPNAALRNDLANRLRTRARRIFLGVPLTGTPGWHHHTRTADPADCGTWTPTSPAHDIPPLPAPAHWGTSHIDRYAPILMTHMPERGILDMPGGIVASDTPITPDGRIIPDLTWWSGDRRPRMPLPVAHTEPTHISGRTLLLSSDWSALNWGHWLMDSIGRLSTLAQAGRTIDEFDHIILPDWPKPDGRRILSALGIDPARLIQIPPHSALRCQHLTIPSFDGVSCAYRATLPAFLQSTVNAPQWWSAPGQRLYIRRGDRTGRRMPNERRMEAIATNLGFRIIEPWLGDNIPDFAGASIIVGIHTAALSNIIFSQPGTHVMEIVPTGHQQLYYRSLANAARLRYSILIGHSTHLQVGRVFGQFCQSPVDVDLLDFQHALCSLITQP